MGCIYIYRNKVNNKAYIGKCHDNLKRRQNEHIGGRGSQLLKQAFDKYGVENFVFEILHDGIFGIFLDAYEIEAIKKYDTVAPNGYNLTYGGDGGSPSADTRKKLSDANKGEKNYWYGRKHTEETIRKISEGNKGKTISAEARQKISKANKGKKRSIETRKRMSESKKGEKNYAFGKPSCRKGKKHTEETKRKISESKKGKKRSLETRRKLSEARRHSSYIPAQNLFTSLSVDMPLKEKRRKIYEAFPQIRKKLICAWVQKWCKP